jgi:hypothetical protein
VSSIEKRPGRPKPWQARHRGPDGKQHAQQFARKIDAERFLAGVETDKLHGSWVDAGRSREIVADWCAKWRATKVELRRSTQARLDTILAVHVLPEFGNRPLASLGNAEVRAWVARLTAEGKSPTTVRSRFLPFTPCYRPRSRTAGWRTTLLRMCHCLLSSTESSASCLPPRSPRSLT